MKRYKLKAGETVDSIAWNYYGYTSGSVEAIFEANPGLCDHNIVFRYEDLHPDHSGLTQDQIEQLPSLIKTIILPDITPSPNNKRIRLWD